MRLFDLPNLLSLLRLPLAAAFLVADSTTARIAIVCAAGFSDLIDGFVARRVHGHDRRTGEVIDPVTDKLFVFIALTMFAVRRELSIGQLLITLTRDIYNTFAFLLLKAKRWPIDFSARTSGKVVTIMQLVLLLALLFWRSAVKPLVWLIGAASLVSIVDYTRAGIRKRRLAAARNAP